MKRNTVFIAYLTNYGGIETFMLRMIEWLKEQGQDVYVFGDKDRNVNEKLADEIRKAGGEVDTISFRGREKRIPELKERFLHKKVLCIVFSYPGAILADEIFGRNDNTDIVFYDPHQFGLMMDYWSTRKRLKPILRALSGYVCKRMYKNHQIIFMDRLCKDRTLTEFGIKEQFADDLLYLPMKIRGFDEQKIEAKYKKGKFTILSICRMDFPFKGYLFGLLDDFKRIHKEVPDSTLTIIGGGKDESRLKEKINSMDAALKESIFWIPGLTYEQLEPYFEEAMLYIGMGTTVMDAVNRGVPALPVGSYTYQCRGYGYFYKDAANLGGLHGEREIFSLIKQIASLDQDAYLELCKKDHEGLAKIYDIDSIGNCFLRYKNLKHGVFNVFERKIVSIGKRYIK